jgi:poly-gamma-glutamate synthesis protein (capsule biosynthesis protein)
MSNFPLSYKLSWLPRLLRPSLAGDRYGFAPAAATLITPARAFQLAFVGDISAVANREAPECDPAIIALLSSADLVVGNCESPVVERPHAVLDTRLGARHAMTERFLADSLAAAGIGREKLILSLANNHALDQGVAGFDETLAALKRLDIRVIGLADEALAKVVIGAAAGIGTFPLPHSVGERWPEGQVRGASAPCAARLPQEGRGGSALTVGFAAFTLWRNAGADAFKHRVSMAGDPSRWPKSVTENIDLLCAIPHWDWEFRHFPRSETRALALRLAGQRAGLIIGGHAHVVQPMEQIATSLVAYGLGDFLGTVFARVPWPLRICAILTVEVSVDEDTRGAIAGWRQHFFVRLREGDHERLVPVDALGEELRRKAIARLEAIYGAAMG